MKMVKCLPEFENFTVFLKNRNFIFKIRISKVTDYTALKPYLLMRLSWSHCLAVVRPTGFTCLISFALVFSFIYC